MRKKIILAASALALTAGVSVYSLNDAAPRAMAKASTEVCPPECCNGTGSDCGPEECNKGAEECCEQ